MTAKLKNIFVIGAVIIFCVLFFIEGEKSEVHTDRHHIRYWYVSTDKDEVPYRVKRFNEIQDSIFVDSTPIPWNENEKKVLTSILSGNPPDVVSLLAPVPRWASRLALNSLDDLIKRDNFDSTMIFPALWQEVKYNNKTYAIPTRTSSYALFYNKKLFREAGLDENKPPKTWDEVIEYSKKITKEENQKYIQAGFIPTYGNLQTSILMAYQLEADFMSKDGTKSQLDNPEMIKALQWVVDYIDEYGIDKTTALLAGFGIADQHGFIKGKIGMMVLDYSFIKKHINKYKPDLEYGVAEIPKFEGYKSVSSLGNFWVAIPRGAKNRNEAWEFIKYLAGKEIQLEDALQQEQESTLFPANIYAANDSAFIGGDEDKLIFIKQMEYAKSPSIIPLAHGTFWREFAAARERSVHKLQTVKEALKQGNKVIQAELDDAIRYNKYVWNKMEL